MTCILATTDLIGVKFVTKMVAFGNVWRQSKITAAACVREVEAV